jgi:uncharacterized protein YbbC (DUF1343 family)
LNNGIDNFIRTYKKNGTRFGILTNHASLSCHGIPGSLELLKNGFQLKKIFSPEHGVYSQAEDGQEQHHGTDRLTNLPVVSLYGSKLWPDARDLDDIDVVLIDLPNIGCRFYTYLWSITFMLEACSQHLKKVLILDRPNLRSNNVHLAEGPLLNESHCASFLGRWQMPVTNGYSYGQLAKWFLYNRHIDVHMDVVNYSATETDQIFSVPPSPAIGNQQTVWLYPFTGLFEGVNVSVGRGTSFPFHVIGAPWIDPDELVRTFRAMDMVGITAYPYSFKPMWSSYAGEFCYGLYFRVDDPASFLPVTTALLLMRHLSSRYEMLRPATYPTAVNPTGERHLDRLLGMENSYDKICATAPLSIERFARHPSVSEWISKVNSFLGLSD